MAQYVIAGDCKGHKGCLVFICGKSLEFAESVLNNVLTNPTPSDIAAIKDYENLRVEEVEEKDCWWLNGTN